ncbi:RNA polymerase sigma factor [Butyricimonas hominis]|jgi:RNA polymerase sigma-70 factor|uniref:RNA polymerase sigma-70 factor n=1 Tax=Butyricimonas hominis TaxID=2763032 RepID=A0ABR7D200_9BACT|nr:RNA polymerase sigma-70 factor [Butyricimonas hominis]MBC5621535.1 RNA polymerase sigma-70 factor [Butyricimonas hominis]
MDEFSKKDELGSRIKKRDVKAFHELYRTSFRPLQHYAMRYLYDWKEAEDIVQEAFLSLWSHPERYDEKQSVSYYLLGIVKNKCMNYLRNLDIQYKHQDKIIEAMLFSNIEDPEIDEDIHERLNRILELLPDKQREVVLLHIVEKKKIKEIAEQMDIAETTVKTHFKRAMTILRNNLKFILFGI